MNENPPTEYRQRTAPGLVVWARRALFALICLITLVALFYAEENWRGARAWHKHRAEWESRGEHFNISALIPPPVPDDKNLAMGALLKPIFDHTNEPTGVVWLDTNGLARLEHFSPILATGRKQPLEFVIPSLEQGTFADFKAWAAFYRNNTNYPQAAPDATPVEVVLTALSGLDTDYNQLREEAAARPELRFPVNYEAQPSWAILLPHLGRVRPMSAYLNVRAIAELEAGKPDRAFADLMLAFRLADGMSQEPLLISHLVQLALLMNDLQTIREGLVRHAWTDAELAELEKYLGGLDLLKEFREAMAGELAFSTSGLDYLRRQGIAAGKTLANFADNGSPDPGLSLMPGGWYYQNMLAISRCFHDFGNPVVDAKERRVYPEAARKADAALAGMSKSPYTIFARMLMPAMDRAATKSARAQVFLDEARVACALERYRLAHRQLPADLNALVPGFISAVPHDVIDGQPLRYRRETDGGYVLYSVGWNGIDDHGTLAYKKQKPSPQVDLFQGDWVWQMPGSQAGGDARR